MGEDVPSKEYIQQCMSSCILGVKQERGLYLYYIELYIIIIPLGIYIERLISNNHNHFNIHIYSSFGQLKSHMQQGCCQKHGCHKCKFKAYSTMDFKFWFECNKQGFEHGHRCPIQRIYTEMYIFMHIKSKPRVWAESESASA